MVGVVFPTTPKGERSTTAFNKAVYSQMAQALGAPDLAEAIMSEKDWRHCYITHLDRLVTSMATLANTDKAKAMDVLGAGLGAASEMEFEGPDGSCTPFQAAMAAAVPVYDTACVKGSGSRVELLCLPYNGHQLSGPALEAQCNKWAEAGTMEPDCAAAIKEGAGKVGLLAGRTFVILGAGSELGPTRPLLEAGATVLAVATRRPERWLDLITFARKSAGTLLLPVRKGAGGGDDAADDAALAAEAGADMLGEAPAVAEWVQRCLGEAQGPVTVGTYLYADGEANVRLTAVSDYIVEAASRLGSGKVSFAWLTSCATALLIPEAAVQAQDENLAKASWWQKLTGQPQKPEPVGPGVRLHRGFESLQGPNYALAQSVRQWRAMLLHSQGFVVSSPVTPMCRTESVCHNRSMATLLDGMAYTPPMEAFEPEACRAAMFSILVSDLLSPPPELPTPFHFFMRKSFHSGLWRCGFEMASLGTSTWMLGKFFPRKVPL